MVYKSKKLNKKKYFKSLQKQSRKLVKKRMYGGEIQENVEYIKKMDVDTPTPTIIDNVSSAANVVASGISNVIADNAQTVAENLGINPNVTISENIKEGISNTGEVLKDINKELNSPEGKELLQETGEIAKNVVTTLKPAAEESIGIINNLVKKEIPILTDMGEKFVLGLPVIGTAFAAGEEAVDATAAALTASSAVAQLTETGAETLKGLNQQKSSFQSLINKGIDLYNNANKGVSNMLSSAQKQVDDYGKSITKRKIEYTDKIGGTLKQYQKEKMMVGGRIINAQAEFLFPSVNNLGNFQQYGGRNKTKRRYNLRSKMTLRNNK